MSGHYGWQQSNHLDVDFWVLTEDRASLNSLTILQDVAHGVRSIFENQHFNIIEFRAIDGPYKPVSWMELESSALIHFLIDDLDSYQARSKCTRFSWRKYPCLIARDRLMQYSPVALSKNNVLNEKWGIRHCRTILSRSILSYPEICIETGQHHELVFSDETPQFLEFCFYATMMNARNFARMDGQAMADVLPNTEFGDWFKEQYNDPFVAKIAKIKAQSRMDGFSNLRYLPIKPQVASWLECLENEIGES